MEQIVEKIIAERRLSRPVRQLYGTVSIDYMMNLTKLLGERLVKNFVLDEDNKFVYENTLKWLFGFPFKCVKSTDGRTIVDGNLYKGLYVAGNTGSGKSLLMTIIAAIGKCYDIFYEYDGEKIPITFADIRTDELCSEFILNGAEIVQKVKNTNVLCLNDFGSEPAEQLYMGNRMNIIRQIIESRADQMGKFTLITSNIPMQDAAIEEKYGARVESRLKQMCNYFVLAGKDRRF